MSLPAWNARQASVSLFADTSLEGVCAQEVGQDQACRVQGLHEPFRVIESSFSPAAAKGHGGGYTTLIKSINYQKPGNLQILTP